MVLKKVLWWDFSGLMKKFDCKNQFFFVLLFLTKDPIIYLIFSSYRFVQNRLEVFF